MNESVYKHISLNSREWNSFGAHIYPSMCQTTVYSPVNSNNVT